MFSALLLLLLLLLLLYQQAQHWQKNTTLRDITDCAQLHFNIPKEIGMKLDNEHWYELTKVSISKS